MDPIIEARVQPSTHRRYRKALKPFLAFILEHRYYPESAAEFDDLLCEWRHSTKVSKANFEGAVAAVEFAVPQFHHQLPWSRAVIHSWSISYVPSHKVPMGEAPAVFIAVHLASRGHPRLGAAIILQEATGMRPSEILGLWGQDVILPEDRAASAYDSYAVLGLGIRTGTKAKRPQSVLLRGPVKVALLRWLRHGRALDEPLVGYTYEQYRRLLFKQLEVLDLVSIGWSPHSPRAGFASDLVAQGVPIKTIMDLGRWLSESSARTYIDVTASASILVTFRMRHLAEAMAYACHNLLSFFPEAAPFLLEQPLRAASPVHGAEGLQAQHDHGQIRDARRLGSIVDPGSELAVRPLDASGEEADAIFDSTAEEASGPSRGRGQSHRFGQQEAREFIAQGRGRSAAARGRGR